MKYFLQINFSMKIERVKGEIKSSKVVDISQKWNKFIRYLYCK